MLRVRVGDTININLKNSPDSAHIHSVDFHAVTGPGGGAAVTQVAPGHSKSFSFNALAPGLCTTAPAPWSPSTLPTACTA